MRSPKLSPSPSTRGVAASQRALQALVTELSQSSLLLRHVALCRLLHAGEYRQFGPAQLRMVAGRLCGAAVVASTAAVLESLAALREAELDEGACGARRPADTVELVRSVAVSQLCEHGYRTVHGTMPPRRRA